MAINDQELEQKLKDLDRAIELGETEEDMDQLDQESGIRSLRKAPSIKMASETPGEEFELEIKMMIKEFEDAVRDGYKGSFEDFANYYFSQKEMMKDRTMAMMGGRMQYADGKKPDAMGNPAVVGPKMSGQEMREFMIMNPGIEDVADYKSYYKKLKAQDEEIKRMLDKAKKEKLKKEKGGVASILGD